MFVEKSLRDTHQQMTATDLQIPRTSHWTIAFSTWPPTHSTKTRPPTTTRASAGNHAAKLRRYQEMSMPISLPRCRRCFRPSPKRAET
jgi:hypothetical protein